MELSDIRDVIIFNTSKVTSSNYGALSHKRRDNI